MSGRSRLSPWVAGPIRALLFSGLLPFALHGAAAAERVTLPLAHVDTEYEEPSGEVISVNAGDDFQAALDRAEPGDIIELEAGAGFQGPFTLPRKPGEEWIIIRSSAVDDGLPPEGNRVTPLHSELMPTLLASTGSVISTEPGAHHYRFIGIEIRPGRVDDASPGVVESLRGLIQGDAGVGAGGIYLTNLVRLGVDEESVEDLPHHIIFDRCYIHGDEEAGARRGIALNSRHSAVIDSWLSDFKEVGADSQAILGWNGPGPFKIANNHLEGAGENVMFGGAVPTIPEMVPSDIEIRNNHFSKPLSWKMDHPSFEGTEWTVKNLFELKNARRVLIDGNVFERNWPHAQNGFAILFTVRNESGAVPWATVEDVTFSNNILRNIASGINILGRDDNDHPGGETSRIAISNNLFEELGGSWGGGTFLQLLDGVDDVIVEGNTVLNTGRILMTEGAPHHRFEFRDNVVVHNDYGIIGSGTGSGRDTLERYFDDPVVRGNILIGAPAARYPEGNFFPRSIEDAGFVDSDGSDYRLGSSAPTEEGRVSGVDFTVLCASLQRIGQPASCN